METSADYIQGVTLASVFVDEVAVANENGFNQLLARCSVEGAKIWTSSNPESSYHWFYLNFIKRAKEKDILYIHFTMDDNPSLSQEIKDRYKKMYSGVWAKRFVMGKWCAAEGLIYDGWEDKYNIIPQEEIPYEDAVKWCVGVDYGTGNATVFLLCMVDSQGNYYICDEYYFEGRKEAQEAGNYEAQKTDLEFTQDMKDFITDHYNTTGKTYRDMDIIVDPAAASFILQMRRFHMKSKRGNNDVLSGIRTVASLINERKLKVCDRCTNLIHEMHTYSWDEKAQARGRSNPCPLL